MRQLLKMALPLAATFAFGMAAISAQAGSSSASSAGSEFLGSSSTSIEKSSDSSSASAKNIVAQGQYKVIDMADIAQRPNMVRVRLQALAPAQTREFFLTLPRQAAERGQLAAGEIVEVEQRPYGLAFATVNTSGNSNPFFLVLDDDWHRELKSRPVVL